MKIVILGGSALSTPTLWSYLIREARLEQLQIILAGRNRDRLQSVWRACAQVAESKENELVYSLVDSKDSWDRFEDTDILLIQIRNGGYAGRSADERFPLRYGVCGDEGLGPGGFSAGMRNWRAIRPALERIEKLRTTPLVVFLSSPVSLLVRVASQTFPAMRIAGICELPWTTLLDICRAVRAEPGEVRFDYLGVNHLGWFHGLASGERDILLEYASARKNETGFPTGALIQSCRGVPLKYLRLHYEREKVVEEQLREELTRGERLEELSRRTFRAYREGDPQDIESALQMRPAPWYRHAVGPLIASLAGKSARIPFFLSVRNEGFDRGFNADDILEIPHVIERGRLRRLPRSNAAPPHVRALAGRFVEYERLACAALLSGEAGDVEKAIKIHPWSDGVRRTAEMAREIASYWRLEAA